MTFYMGLAIAISWVSFAALIRRDTACSTDIGRSGTLLIVISIVYKTVVRCSSITETAKGRLLVPKNRCLARRLNWARHRSMRYLLAGPQRKRSVVSHR